jgi:hypothetical protein
MTPAGDPAIQQTSGSTPASAPIDVPLRNPQPKGSFTSQRVSDNFGNAGTAVPDAGTRMQMQSLPPPPPLPKSLQQSSTTLPSVAGSDSNSALVTPPPSAPPTSSVPMPPIGGPTDIQPPPVPGTFGGKYFFSSTD